jgi:aspartyl/asparaginyl beta-hydroxylase (cupin superfamily)
MTPPIICMIRTRISILEPGRRLVTHEGPDHGILRYHLALDVPEDTDKCTLIVGNEVRHWYEGEDILFDDTLPHSATNQSDEVRVVLFLDVLRPLQSTCRSYLNAWFHGLFAPNTQHVTSIVQLANEASKRTPTTSMPINR